MDTSELLTALNWRYATKLFDPSKKIRAATWAGLGELALAWGDTAQARTRHEEALRSRVEAGEVLGAAESRLALAQVLLVEWKAGDGAAAAREAALALEAQDAKDLAAMARALEVKAALAAGDRRTAQAVVATQRVAWGASESPAARAAG